MDVESKKAAVAQLKVQVAIHRAEANLSCRCPAKGNAISEDPAILQRYRFCGLQ